MDADSFIFDEETNFDEIRLKHKEYFDLSDYPKDNKMHDSANKKGIRNNEE